MKAVLFDMDGVLIDSELPAFSLLRNTLMQKGVLVEMEELLAGYVGMNSNAIYAALIKTYGFPQTVDELRAEHHRVSGDYYSEAPLVPMQGLMPLLRELRAKQIKMAVVSSTASRSVLTVLNRLSLLCCFDAVVGGDMVQAPKPSPEGYRMAAALLGAAVCDCLAVEDSCVGIQAAKSAGIAVAGFKGSAHWQDTTAADFEIQSFAELPLKLREYTCAHSQHDFNAQRHNQQA